MKQFYLLFLSFFLLILSAIAQDKGKPIRLKNGMLMRTKNLQTSKLNRDVLKTIQYRKKLYTIIQFDKLPDSSKRKELTAQGIILTDYIPDNSFMAEMPEHLDLASLKTHKINGVYAVNASDKLSEKLQRGIVTRDEGAVIAVSFFTTITKAEAAEEIIKAGGQIVSTKIQLPNVLFIKPAAEGIKNITRLPFVTWVSEQVIKDEPLNYNNRGAHALDALSSFSGRNLEGKNVTIGMGDDADPSTHIDFAGRLIVRTPVGPSFHGTHTTGTTGGAGIIIPMNKGMAPKARLVNQYFSDILVNAPYYLADYNMILTNNSYYSGLGGCPGNGQYDFLSSYADGQLYMNPTLLHIFASGNDGGFTCTPYPLSYATVKSGFQCGKNVLTVGNLDAFTYTINSASSRGPVSDGRLKPEIVAGGTSIISTSINNSYISSTGTSMAAPTVTGTLALLYEEYRKLHTNTDPPAALIKAVVCNSATDLGIPGPDFTYGFGMLNARAAVEALDDNRYFINTVNNGGSNTHTITGVPAGAQQLKVMLYWLDYPAAPFASSALVNNLDLSVTAPGPSVHLPLVLNAASSNVADTAIENIDNKNNIEQVVINTPPAGNFTITVHGSNVPAGPQQYVVTYEVLTPSVTVEYPFGNETILPGTSEIIRWNAVGPDNNTFTIEYSGNNGFSWVPITNNAPATSRSYTWTTPSTATNTALIRVTRNVDGYTDVSDYNFVILGQPALTVTNPCPGYAQLSWGAITSATSYEIMMLKGDSMQTIATTTSNSYLLGGLDKNASYWLGVRAINATVAGRRSNSINITPAGGACATSTFDNDFVADSLIAPATGRQFSNSQLGTLAIVIRLKNNGTIPSSGSYNISYQVNSDPIVTESSSHVIAAHNTYDYSFTQLYNFSAAGTYTIKVWVAYTGDLLAANDTVSTVVKHLQNIPIVLSPTYTEGFESASPQTYSSNVAGFEGLDRCDFRTSNTNGRARTFVNTGFARTGSRCITLDQAHNSLIASADSLITTFNLSGYGAMDQLWLNFYYKNHGIDFTLPNNKVWIRGSETSAWIPVYTLPVLNTEFGQYKPSGSIDITQTLATALQSVSSTFQIKFGQEGYTSANSVVNDANLDDGYSFDDISITLSSNDVGIQAVINPDLNDICTLSNNQPITVQVKNFSSSTLNSINVSYDINGNIVTENIPTLAPGQVLPYTFSQTANLSAFQQYTMRAWVNYSGDNFKGNDSLLNIKFNTTPLISTYPYVEGFEINNGRWFTGGVNSSWQWGTPAKTIIHSAASGAKAWVTSLTGNYNTSEFSYLYSPCFNLSSLSQPALTFSHIFRMEDNCNCDYHWMEYSLDGTNWIKLGAAGNGTNWYDNAPLQIWKASNTTWHTSGYEIPTTASKVRFRFVVNSDAALSYEGIGIDNFSIFDNAVLPLLLGSFTATKNGSSALLEWTTLQEFQTDKFIIERSGDGANFFAIGEVNAAGNSNVTQNYQFTDDTLLNGVSYYRLKLIDSDGHFAYSPVRSINYLASGSTITVYPNPVTANTVYINTYSSMSKIELTDVWGRIIKTVNAQGTSYTLSLHGIAKGTYFASVTTLTGRKVVKVVIQ